VVWRLRKLKQRLGFSSYTVRLWLHIGLVYVLLIEKIIVSIIIQCFLIKSKSDAKIIFGGIDCLKFNHEVMNQNGTS
jgi:hypothetical protein